LGEPAVELDNVATIDPPKKVPSHMTGGGDQGLDRAQVSTKVIVPSRTCRLVPAITSNDVQRGVDDGRDSGLEPSADYRDHPARVPRAANHANA
jgi:hypothetical protein